MENSGYYILNGQEAVECDDLVKWAKWFGENMNNRHVASDVIGDVRVSTVFLGLDHSLGDANPLLFETMVFCGKHDGFMVRCSTWKQAEKQHTRIVSMVREDITQ